MSTITLISFECRSSVCLPMRGMGMNTWIDMVEDNHICCDELALLGLSAMYQRHCLVVTKNKFWSTIETKEPLSIINLMKECTVRLLYLGNMKFGTLHWHPCNPQPVQPKPNLGQFKIIEEIHPGWTPQPQEKALQQTTVRQNMWKLPPCMNPVHQMLSLWSKTTNFLLFLWKLWPIKTH